MLGAWALWLPVVTIVLRSGLVLAEFTVATFAWGSVGGYLYCCYYFDYYYWRCYSRQSHPREDARLRFAPGLLGGRYQTAAARADGRPVQVLGLVQAVQLFAMWFQRLFRCRLRSLLAERLVWFAQGLPPGCGKAAPILLRPRRSDLQPAVRAQAPVRWHLLLLQDGLGVVSAIRSLMARLQKGRRLQE